MDEQEAISRLRQRDIKGLEELVHLYQLTAVRAVYLVTRDRFLAEDIVQSAFVRAYERISQLDMDRPFGPWFLRSVLNDAIKAAERRGGKIALDSVSGRDETLLEALTTIPGPENEIERAEMRRAVRAAVEGLPPSHRAVVVQRYFLGLSEAEMVHQLGCPPGTVKRRLHEARDRLRILLAPDKTVASGLEDC